MSTQDLPAVRSALAMTTYPPQTASVRAARCFVVDALEASGLPGLADDAGLVVSELAANAVLHARTDFDVAVCELDGGVRVTVRDRSPALPVLVAPSASAMSGRGLALVERLAARWGAGPSPVAGKSVWFELLGQPQDAVAAGVAELSVEQLIAAWSDDAADDPTDDSADDPSDDPSDDPAGSPSTGSVDVVLPALVAADLLVAKERMDDVLREVQLVLLSGGGPGAPAAPAPGRGLAAARRLDEAARAFDDVRRQVRRQVSRAVAAGEELVALRLHLAAGTARRATAYRAAVEAAEELAELQGTLLSVADTLVRHRAVRRAYLDEVIAATGC